ncbi:hypothetical protein [Cloacibacillus porcorum]|uniref:hypothetical protein n=1 Tax=Cloacibacillus porcorum TaxID=1197717 RepID=UPI0023F10CBE|nr:hypothetical protein [Cloacibacillus porcorum]MCC8184975.1 hypothetical protein [Cloacibacillus porcorum]
MPTEKPRIIITLDDDLFQQIEDIRYKNRIPSRSQATLKLLELGIKAMLEQQQEQEKPED